jgi:methionine-rich copper-binding protein CopC
MRGLLARLGVAGALGVAAVLAVAAPAWAHNYYVSSTPGMNEVLTTLPDEFVVTTNDNLLDLGGSGAGFIMEIVGPDGLYYGDGCVTVSGPSVSMAAAAGPAGDYTLDWQVISADGHTVSGAVPFTWQPAADAETSTAGAASPPRCGSDATAPGGNDAPGQGAEESGTDALWIGGAVIAVAIAVVATLLLLRKKPE